MTKAIFDKQKFRKAIKEMATNAFADFSDFSQSFIVDEKRDYPRETKRRYGRGKTGKIARSPRDVVDSGKLRDSFSEEMQLSPTLIKLILTWSADHASLIYAGHDNVPPYPWVLLGLREFDWEKAFQQYWLK